MSIELSPDERAALRKLGAIGGTHGQRTLRAKFRAQVDRQTPGLPADEREALADQLYREHMRDLGYRSGEVRRAG